MKGVNHENFNKIATAVTLSLGLAATAYAQQGPMGAAWDLARNRRPAGAGLHGHGSGRMQTMQGGMGRMQAMNYGGRQGAGCQQGNRGTGCDFANNPGARPKVGQQLMTPEERIAMREKMRTAATPEERQQLMAANHAEMQKRAAEKGITLPEQPGPYGRAGRGPNAAQ